MKKLFFLLVIGIVTFNSLGQDTKLSAKRKPYFGVKAGVNMINSSNYDGGHHLNFGYQFGGTLTIPMSSRFSFQPELVLQSIGIATKYTNVYYNGTTSQETKYKNTYVLVPLDFKYAFSDKFDLEFGPNIAIALSSKKTYHDEYYIDGTLSIYDNSNNNISNLRKFVFGFNIGTNYAITSNIYSGFRYTIMVGNNISKTTDNSIFALSVGYNFR